MSSNSVRSEGRRITGEWLRSDAGIRENDWHDGEKETGPGFRLTRLHDRVSLPLRGAIHVTGRLTFTSRADRRIGRVDRDTADRIFKLVVRVRREPWELPDTWQYFVDEAP